jgi:hypothetical protein
VLGEKQYCVEVSQTRSDFMIAAFDSASPESYLIELPIEKSCEIMEQFGNSHIELVKFLKVVNKRLVLLNPVS